MRTTGIARAIGLTTLFLIAGFLLLPLIVLAGTSLSQTSYLSFPPQGLTLDWYTKALTDPAWVDAIVFSTVISILATTVAVLVALPAAIALTRRGLPLRTRGAIESLLTLPMLVPQIVLGVGLMQWLLVLGIGRSLVGFVLAHTVLALPFVLRSVLASLVSIPLTFERAASDLGASPGRAFWHVTLPLIRPGVAAGCVFGFGISYINVEVSMFLSTPESTPLPVMLLNHVAYTVDSTVSAVSTLTVLIALGGLILLDRFTGLERVGATA